MIFAQALTDGVLVMAGVRFLLRSLEEGRWCVDRQPVDIDPGVIVSFAASDDRDHFLRFEKRRPARAQVPEVKKGEILLFAFEDDVALLEADDVIRRLTQEEIDQVIAQAQAGEPVHIAEPVSDVEAETGRANDEETTVPAVVEERGKRKKRSS